MSSDEGSGIDAERGVLLRRCALFRPPFLSRAALRLPPEKAFRTAPNRPAQHELEAHPGQVIHITESGQESEVHELVGEDQA